MGKKAFDGETVGDVIGAVLRSEPDLDVLPPSVRSLVRRCFAKDAKRRLRDIGEARLAIDESADAGSEEESSAVLGTKQPRWAWAAAGLCVLTAVAGWLVGRGGGASENVSLAVSHLSIEVDPADALGAAVVNVTSSGFGMRIASLTRTAFALSPDGRHLVFAGREGDRQMLFHRKLADPVARPISGTEDSVNPLFSPDGESIAFWSAGQIKKIALAGGSVLPICDVASPPAGATWTSDNRIVFGNRRGGLQAVSANGGEPVLVTGHDIVQGNLYHRLPWALPDSDVVLFTERNGNRFDQASILAQSLSSGDSKVVLEGGAHPIYATSGHLLYTKLGVVWAVPFDAETLQTIGEPTAVISEIVQSLRTGTTDENTGAAQMSLSASGTLAYLPGEPLETEVRTLVWVDRQGDVERLPFERGLFWYPRLSPDGLRVATNDRDRILILDLIRGVTQRLPGSGSNVGGWSPDGHRVVFNADDDAGGAPNLFMQPADGSTPAERLTRDDKTKHFGGSWLPDGSALLFAGGGDIFELDGQRLDEEPTTLLGEPFREWSPDPSPDGRWLAYASDESGRFEVYVRAYPSLEGKQQVSQDGGTMPAWSKDGRELYYTKSDSADLEYAMMAVSVSAESSFQASTPRELFRGRFLHTRQLRTYDVASDGRFLMIERGEDRPTHTSVRIVLNWLEELERLVPTDR